MLPQLAEVARTPWLDPYVAGGILAAKALSEGDWRIGKGAMAGWADRALSSLFNTGAKVLRVGSGNEVRPNTTPTPPSSDWLVAKRQNIKKASCSNSCVGQASVVCMWFDGEPTTQPKRQNFKE